MPLRGVPAGQEDAGGIYLVVLEELKRDVPRETRFGVGGRGFEEGDAAPPIGLASNRRDEDTNERLKE